tara:strand:+ start:5167 stop:6063 length:897 start_codon:yes stop_codon:yes gene_type:complete
MESTGRNNVPLVSVCMITYNHEQFINKAIKGVINQNCSFDFEFIISDDCSSDNTPFLISEAVDKFNKKIPIKYFSQNSNLGIIKNFVFALNQCSGKYIAICEGDDYWVDNGKLSKQADLLENDGTLVGSFHFVKVEYENKPHLSNIFKSSVPEIIGTEDLIAPSSLIHTSSLFFKRDALIFPEWYLTMLSGDFALTSILSKQGKFKRINDVMSVYRVHDQGVTSSINYNKEKKLLKISILEKLNDFHDYKYNDKFQDVIYELRSQNLNQNIFIKIRRKLRIGLIIKRVRFWLTKIYFL